MTTQILFNIDKATKAKASRRAAREGLPLSAFLKQATRAYAEETLSLEPVLVPNKKTARILDKADKDIKAGKNLSPAFATTEDLLAYLDKRVGYKKR